MKRAHWKAIGSLACLTTCALLLGSCRDKDGNFFLPTPFGPIALVDITSPIITNQLPASNIFLNDDAVTFDAIDGTGALNEPVSGLNVPGMRATWGTVPLTMTQSLGNTFSINVTPMSEGLQSISLQVPDNAGNQATGSFTFRLDRSAPVITANVPATGSTTQATATINMTGGFTDNFAQGASELTILQAVNGQCALGNPQFPTGTTPGTVVNNRYQFGAGVNTFDVPVVFTGAPDAQRPKTVAICSYLRSEDQALARDGTPRPNVSGRMFRTDYTWNPAPVLTGTIAGTVSSSGQPLNGVTVSTGMESGVTNASGNYSIPNLIAGPYTLTVSNLPAGYTCPTQQATVTGGQTTTVNFDCSQVNFTVSLSMSYVHVGPGDSKSCARISAAAITANSNVPIALESIPGASYSISWSGPGVVGGTQRAGTLNAQSEALDRQDINLFGSYTANVTVTYLGVSRMASGTVSVGGTQGTCPAP